jgi:hypothetical protein
MSAIATILLGVAAKVGAPIVKSILQEHIGGLAGKVGGSLIDAIAEKAGVAPAELPNLPEKELEKAVLEVERADAPELLTHLLESQRLANELMMKEMDSGPFWSWAWRPGGMYVIGFWWMLYILVWPLLNLFLRLFGASEQLETIVDVATLLAISGGFISLYMGGYTALKGIEKWKGTQR